MTQRTPRNGVRKAIAAGLFLALAVVSHGCSAQQPASPADTPAGNKVAMNFDLSKCQQTSPHLYQCPGSDKPICDPGYNKGDVECIKVDDKGVLIQVP